MAAPTFGQAIRYEIIDLGSLGDSPTHIGSTKGQGINDCLVVAGISESSDGAATRAIAWSYCPGHGIPVGDWWKLTPFNLTENLATCPTSGCLNGDARAVNEHDMIVGMQEIPFGAGTTERAFVWRLSTLVGDPGPASLAIAALPGSQPGVKSIANDVNDLDPPRVVGNWQLGTCPTTFSETGFIWTYSPSGNTPVELPPQPVGDIARANAVDNNAPIVVAGQVLICDAATSCLSTSNAVLWNAVALDPDVMPKGLVAGQVGNVYGTEARGRNDAGMTVGSIRNSLSAGNCVQHAAFWEDGQQGLVLDLGLVNGGSFSDVTVANAVAEFAGGTVRVVGKNLSQAHALLWECIDCDQLSERFDPARWTRSNLANVISKRCGIAPLEALDINSHGWIVGYGSASGTLARGFVLRPIECLADLDRDCDVDGADLGVFLGNWGTSCFGSCAACHSDLNGDAFVDGADLGILLGRFNAKCACTDPCMSCGNEATATAQQTAETDEPNEALSLALEGAVGSLGFVSVSQFCDWLEGTDEETAKAAAYCVHAQLMTTGGGS